MRFSFKLAVPGLLSVAFALASSGCASSREETVSLGEVPAPVRDTLQRESAGGTITEIERETKKGKIVYSADAEVGGKQWDIAVAEDGTLLSKEVEK